MFVSRKKLNLIKSEEYSRGMKVGYKLACQNVVMVVNRHLMPYGLHIEVALVEQGIVESQVEEIVDKEGF